MFPIRVFFQAIVLRIVLQIQRLSIPSKQGADQETDTLFKRQCGFVQEIKEMLRCRGPGTRSHRIGHPGSSSFEVGSFVHILSCCRSTGAHPELDVRMGLGKREAWKKGAGESFCVLQNWEGWQRPEQRSSLTALCG